MKTILILDMWYGMSGGASKKVLYGELSKIYHLKFVKIKQPNYLKILNYLLTFHVNFNQWKMAKSRREATLQMYPQTFQIMTKLINKEVKKLSGTYDAVLQMGSLFGPISIDTNKPYFSYHDSTVRNPDVMWADWLPDDFSQYRQQWYELEKNFFKSTTYIFTYSQWVKKTLIEYYQISPQKISPVGSALKIAEDYSIDWSHRLTKKNIVFVSTDFKRKGGDILINVFDEIFKHIPDVKLIMVGKIPNEIQKLNKPWLDKRGVVNKQELIEIYKFSRIMIHPAIYDPFPSVILEAANFEIPCVASDICGIPEMINNQETGFLIKDRNPKDFIERIIYMLQNNNVNETMGKKAKHYVNQKFHPSAVVENMKKIIERAIT